MTSVIKLLYRYSSAVFLWGPGILKAITLFLLVPHLILLAFHVVLLATRQAGPSLETVLYGGLVFISMLFFIHGVRKDRKKDRAAVRHRYIILPLVLACVLIWLALDGAPPENDFQKQDVVCASDSGYHLLKQLSDMDARTVLEPVLTEMETAGDNPVQAAAGWKKIAMYRQMVDTLAEIETICDLSFQSPVDETIVYLNYTSFRTLTRIYNRHFLSGVRLDAQIPADKSADEFIRLFNLWTRVFKNARTLLHKILFAALLESQIQTAFQAVSLGWCDQKTLDQLENMTRPLDKSAISLKLPIITEYLILKNTLKKLTPEHLLDRHMIAPDPEEPEQGQSPHFSKGVYYFCFKPNMTLSGIKSWFDHLILVCDQHPADFNSATDYMDRYMARLPVKNMVGWVLNAIALPDPTCYWARVESVKIKTDLLSAAINLAQGKQLSTTDLYTQRALRFREKSDRMIHPGADGQYCTEDDIILACPLCAAKTKKKPNPNIRHF